MDAEKSPDLMYGKEYKGHTKNKGISLEWDGSCEVP